MKNIIARINLICAVILIASCSPAPNIEKTEHSSEYRAQSGNYSVPIPTLAGGRIDDGPTGVSFIDDFGQLFRIEELRLPQQELDTLATMGRLEYLKSFVTKYYLQNTILRALPSAKIVAEEYLAEIRGGAYYIDVFMPQGSTAAVSTNGGPPEREDANRGILVFIFEPNIFIASTQLMVVPLPKENSAEEMKRLSLLLKKNTVEFSGTISFSQNPQDAQNAVNP